jgi:hypothetical protein
MMIILWTTAGILTLGLAVGLVLIYVTSTKLEDVDFQFEDGEEW